jgi:hypothetical protein
MGKRKTEEIEKILKTKYQLKKKGEYFIGTRRCKECDSPIEQKSKSMSILLRNIKRMENATGICSSCARKGERNHFYNCSHSTLTKKKISRNRKGKATGDDNAMAHSHYRKKVSQALKDKYASGDLDFLKEIQRQNAIQGQIEGRLKCAPISKAEKELAKTFRRLNYRVKSQHLIESYHFDLFVEELNLVIEYNGDYWHCNPLKYAPDFLHPQKQITAMELWEHDQMKKDLAIERGYNYHVIWESDYNKDPEFEIKNIIQTYVK